MTQSHSFWIQTAISIYVLAYLAYFPINSFTILEKETSIKEIPPVLPGEKGFALYTPAGRNGRVLFVSNLRDSGSDSLREALEFNGPRTIIFEVSGTIHCKSPLMINDPFVTIAGQTAPSPGILIKGSLMVNTHDVLIQHLSIRPGIDGVYTDALSIGIEGRDATDIVVDHCSFAWATDEVIEVLDRQKDLRLSFLHCLISSSIPDRENGDEYYGQLMYGKGKVDIQKSYFAHHGQRTPMSSMSDFAFINNVCYNRAERFVQLAGEREFSNKNLIVGNVFQEGPDLEFQVNEKAVLVDGSGLRNGSRISLLKNAYNSIIPIDQKELLFGPYEAFWEDDPDVSLWDIMETRSVAPFVLARAGSRPVERLPLDKAVIADFLNYGTSGSYIDHKVLIGLDWQNEGPIIFFP